MKPNRLTTDGKLSPELVSERNEPGLRVTGTRVDSAEVLIIDINTIEPVLYNESGHGIGGLDGIKAARSGLLRGSERRNHQCDTSIVVVGDELSPGGIVEICENLSLICGSA